MFTGIIEEIGTIRGIKRGNRSVVLEVQAKKVLEESAELMVASQHDTREHMLDEFADVLQTLANFYKYSGITDNEITSAIDRCNKKNIARDRMTDNRPFVERVTIYNN